MARKMTEENKELLLEDLCARLRHHVKVHCEWSMFQGDRVSEDGELVSINIHAKSIHFKRSSGRITEIPFNRIDGVVLPYLRPMSSMTEEEYKELKSISSYYGFAPYKYIGDWCPNYEMIDWLNSHHFDYRNLIEKGLALEAKEGMYK